MKNAAGPEQTPVTQPAAAEPVRRPRSASAAWFVGGSLGLHLALVLGLSLAPPPPVPNGGRPAMTAARSPTSSRSVSARLARAVLLRDRRWSR